MVVVCHAYMVRAYACGDARVCVEYLRCYTYVVCWWCVFFLSHVVFFVCMCVCCLLCIGLYGLLHTHDNRVAYALRMRLRMHVCCDFVCMLAALCMWVC